MLKVNGTDIKTPAETTWSLEDLSSDNSGRSLDGIMHKDRVAQKRKLVCKWAPMTWAECSALLTAVNASVELSITYPDLMSGSYETRTFYIGSRTVPILRWTGAEQLVENISFDFIEV